MAFPVSPKTLAAASRALSFWGWTGPPDLPALSGAAFLAGVFGAFTALAEAACFCLSFFVAMSDLLRSLQKPAARHALPYQGGVSYLVCSIFQGFFRLFWLVVGM